MKRKNDQAGNNFKLMTASGVILLLFSLYFIRETVLLPCREAIASRNWLPTQAEVVSASLTARGTELRIDYRYTVGGRPYGSHRYDFFGRTHGTAETLLPLLRRFPAGKRRRSGRSVSAVPCVRPKKSYRCEPYGRPPTV